MAKSIEITVPDLGNAANAEVIEVAVAAGQQIKKDDPLITLESDKASMEIPAPQAGIVEAVKVKVGDKVNTGSLILTLKETSAANQAGKSEAAPQPAAKAEASTNTTQTTIKDVVVPDLGNANKVDVIEVNVAVGDEVHVDAPLITLESEKAAMEIPAPFAGIVKELKVKAGDKVSSGSLILKMQVSGAAQETATKPALPAATPGAAVQTESKPVSTSVSVAPESVAANASVHAGPAVRRLAREFGVNLQLVKGSGPKSRILKEDVQAFVKNSLARLQGAAATGSVSGLNIAPLPQIDFAKFGAIETKPLSRIKKLSGANLHRNWVTVPHITQFDEADITELEAFRKAQQALADKQGFKLTPLVFLMKAVVAALQAYPQFNASLDASGENLILKKYFHIGVAVDTPDGLVVPVIRDVDQKGLFQLARELSEVSAKARNKALTAADMQGSCFTISSLGGIGGTAFTPIVNVPDVAILGVSKAMIKPVYQDGQFVPRLMLPLSLSYDHRVIDGAEGARFITHLTSRLTDIRQLLL